MPDRRLLVLLLPDKLERMAAREHAEALLRAPGAVAVEPPAAGALAGMPKAMRDRIAVGQAKRMALPGHPKAVVAYEAAQYPLALALVAMSPEAELWYGGDGDARAAITFSGGDPGPLFERMEALGIESGRLGSERAAPRGGTPPP